jgi:hypothetical protein
MRAFLAVLWLVEETPTLPALQNIATDAGAFGLNRRDQEELWGFVAPLLTSAADLEACGVSPMAIRLSVPSC